MKKYSKVLLVVALIALTLVSLELVAFSAGSSSQKKTDRAIASYTKKIDKAEQKSCNTKLGKSATALSKSCARAVKSLDKAYARYTDEFKANPQVASLYKRQEELQQLIPVLEHQAAVDKVAREYRRKIESTEAKACKEADHYGVNTDLYCADEVAKIDKIKARIPADMLAEAQVKELVARHEKLKAMPQRMAKIIAGADKEFMEGAMLKGDFQNAVHDIDYWSYLEGGKANKPAGIEYLDAVNKQMPKYKQLAEDCKGKYAKVVAKNEQFQAQCELAENAEKYRDMFAAASYKQLLKTESDEINKVIAGLERNKVIEIHDYNRYALDSKKYVADVKAKVKSSYKKMGLAEPSYSDFEAAVANLKAKIESVADSTEWDDNKTVSVSSAIEKRTVRVAKKMGLELVEVGRVDEPWTLIKNGLGIPLRKATKGWVMLKNSKESFCRVQLTHFFREYDGSKYVSVSDVDIISGFIPATCN